MSGSRTSNLPGERLRPPRRVSTTLPGGTHSRQKSPCSLSSAPLSSERQQIHRCKCRRRKDSVAANRHRSGVLVVCRLQPPVSTRTYVQNPPPQRPRPVHRFWGYAIGTMAPPLMRTEHFRCGAAVAISAGNRRISGRVASFSPCPLARGWVAGLARRYCVRALEPVRGGCNLSDSDPSPARCQLKKQTSPTSCSGLGCWSQSFATLATRKNPARHASLVRQPRPITTRTHPTVGSMSPLPRRLRLVRRTDAIGFQNRRGMRLNRQGGAGIVRHFFPSPVTMT